MSRMLINLETKLHKNNESAGDCDNPEKLVEMADEMRAEIFKA